MKEDCGIVQDCGDGLDVRLRRAVQQRIQLGTNPADRIAQPVIRDYQGHDKQRADKEKEKKAKASKEQAKLDDALLEAKIPRDQEKMVRNMPLTRK